MFRAFLILASVVAALLLPGCGIKGPLQPPSPETQPAKKQQAAPAP